MMTAFHINHAGMDLQDLLSGFSADKSLTGVSVNGLSLDSRTIHTGDVYLALSGTRCHGLKYAQAAIDAGAVAVLWETASAEISETMEATLKSIRSRVPVVGVDALSEKAGLLADRFFAMPSRDMKVIGVTGTDGKTSVSHFIAQCLHNDESGCGILGTLGNGFPGSLKASTHTTPDAITLQRELSLLRDSGAAHVAMEVSSHGLDQNRVGGVRFDIAVLTNLSRDHFDYHGDIKHYREAKKRLFESEGLSSVVLNLDDEFGAELADELSGRLAVQTYAVSNKPNIKVDDFSVIATGVETTAKGLVFNLHENNNTARVAVNMIGQFNVYNILATFCVLRACGCSFDDAIRRISVLKAVQGRMEIIHTADAKKPVVVVDFAHTPNALASALKSLRQHVDGKIWCVFGCGGDRDREKRPLMAAEVEQLADHAIVTSDNPRNENPQDIVDDIIAGLKNPAQCHAFVSRKEAICFAVKHAAYDDLVLIAGKGHEQVQIVGNNHVPFDDRQVAAACLESES